MARNPFQSTIAGLAAQFSQLPVTPAITPMDRPATPAAIPSIQQSAFQQFNQQPNTPALPGINQPIGQNFASQLPSIQPMGAQQGIGFGINQPIGAPPPITAAPPTTGGALGNAGQGVANQFGGGGQAGNAGGQWSTLDALNPALNAAANQTSVPANLIKSMLAREGSFGQDKYATDVGRTKADGTPDLVYAFNGIFQSTAQSYGIDWNRMQSDDAYAVWAMGRVLQGTKENHPELGSWDNVAKYYFAGPNWNTGWTDETGENTPDNYAYGDSGVITRWHQLDGSAGGTGGGGNDAMHGAKIVDIAKQYLGVPYVWGSLPGVNDDPRVTGWDCSAFVNYLDDKYGSNQIPAGSHYQYQDAVSKGTLFTDSSQLQAGDIVFFDTGPDNGGGAELNRAGHVGMYIGNGQVINALNPSAGTVISNISDIGGFMGAEHMSWSSGSWSGGGTGSGTSNGWNNGRGMLNYRDKRGWG